MVVGGTQVQGCALLVRVAVHLGTVLDKDACGLEVADIGGMVERCPTVSVDVVHVGMAVLNDGFKSIGFLLFIAKYSLVDRSFSKNAHSFIDLVTTVNQVPQVLGVGLCSCLVEVLDDTAGELILADL